MRSMVIAIWCWRHIIAAELGVRIRWELELVLWILCLEGWYELLLWCTAGETLFWLLVWRWWRDEGGSGDEPRRRRTHIEAVETIEPSCRHGSQPSCEENELVLCVVAFDGEVLDELDGVRGVEERTVGADYLAEGVWEGDVNCLGLDLWLGILGSQVGWFLCWCWWMRGEERREGGYMDGNEREDGK